MYIYKIYENKKLIYTSFSMSFDYDMMLTGKMKRFNVIIDFIFL